MANGWQKAGYFLPVIGQLWWIGERIADRVRARRARRRGEVACPSEASDRELFDAGKEVFEDGRDAVRKARK